MKSKNRDMDTKCGKKEINISDLEENSFGRLKKVVICKKV